MTDLRCPQCGDHYGPPARFCIRDGYALVPARPSDPKPTPESLKARRVWSPGAVFADPASSLTGRFLDERYEVGEQIGEGGMAYVYRGIDRRGARPVAVKVLSSRLVADTEAVARLKREAELAMRLAHPNVCHVLDVGTDRGLHYLILPLLIGESLNTRLEIEGTLGIGPAIQIIGQICEGLQHAHDRGVLHRDLKPENVMLVPESGAERAVVMDFGLAKPASTQGDIKKLTDTGVVLGTPEFMSPEQIRGAKIDHRSDQYAVGILAFEMLTGELPFKSGNSQETMMHRLTDIPLRLSEKRADIPPGLDAAVARALDRDPTRRFPDLHAFRAAIDAVAE